MARSLKEVHTWLRIASIAGALTGHALAYADSITDPTRPPVVVAPVQPGEEATSGIKLQAVMITPTSRAAIISGERVELGATYRDARVVRITEQEVVLRSPDRTQTLKMYPDLEMKPSTGGAAKPGAKKR